MRNKKENSIDPAALRKAIWLIDSYRADLFYDLTWIEKKAEEGNLGRSFHSKWKDLKNDMMKMASVTSRVPGITKLARMQGYFESLSQISIPLIVFTGLVDIMVPGGLHLPFPASYLTVVMVSLMIASLAARSLMGKRIGAKIEGYLRNNPDTNKLKKFEVKDAVQSLIEELRKYLSETGKVPKKHLVGLTFLDYDHVEMVSKPRPWRRYYLAQVTVKIP